MLRRGRCTSGSGSIAMGNELTIALVLACVGRALLAPPEGAFAYGNVLVPTARASVDGDVGAGVGVGVVLNADAGAGAGSLEVLGGGGTSVEKTGAPCELSCETFALRAGEVEMVGEPPVSA